MELHFKVIEDQKDLVLSLFVDFFTTLQPHNKFTKKIP